MADRPMIFSPQMVRALWYGIKTQTRRPLKRPTWAAPMIDVEQDADGVWGLPTKSGCWKALPIPQIGDRIWVRENWRPVNGYSNWDLIVRYPANEHEVHLEDGDAAIGDWTWPKAAERGNVPSIHMPRWASRITLLVTDVRIERLQDISEQDAKCEGITPRVCTDSFNQSYTGWNWDWSQVGEQSAAARSGILTPHELALGSPRLAFANLWGHVNGPAAWDNNPVVAATTFTVVRENLDRLKQAA